MYTNADGLSKEKKAKLEAEDNQIEHVADQIGKRVDAAKTEGQGYEPIEWVEGRENVVTFDMLKDGRREEFAPVIPAGYEFDLDNRLIWKLTPYHHEMAVQGKICYACLEWQSEVGSTHCLWKGKSEGCGAERVGFASEHELFGRRK